MRSNFFKENKKINALKVLDRVIALVVAVFFLMLATVFVYGYIERKYVYPLRYKEIVVKNADEYGFNSALVFAIIKVESGFDKRAISNAGAVGLMQITPETADYIAELLGEEKYELFNENTNVKFGCFYLRYLLKRFNDLDTALCAYNAGEGRVEKWLANYEYSLNGKKLNKIPYKETRDYIQKIHKSYKKYNEIYKNFLDKD